jgi:uncharacterized protein DUF6913
LSPIKNIQLKLGKFKLKNEKKKLKRDVKAFNLSNASTVGVIYNATNRNDYELAKKFVQYLKEERKDVLSLGYINSKNSDDVVKPHLNYQFFDNTSISKIKVPNSIDAKSFISKSFSILIDLNTEDCFPIEYITTLSRAKFKVGAAGNYRNEECDLTIDISQNNNLDYLIIQIKHYLKMINP